MVLKILGAPFIALFAAFSPMIGYPWIAFPIGGALQLLAWRRRARFARWVGVLWFGYGVYEYLMKFRVLCTGECNIRVDLIPIYPLLFVASLVAIVRAVKKPVVATK